MGLLMHLSQFFGVRCIVRHVVEVQKMGRHVFYVNLFY